MISHFRRAACDRLLFEEQQIAEDFADLESPKANIRKVQQSFQERALKDSQTRNNEAAVKSLFKGSICYHHAHPHIRCFSMHTDRFNARVVFK